MAKGDWRKKPFVRVVLISNTTSERVSNRVQSLAASRREILKQFGGVGASGANTWPENMPRTIRRQIERDSAKRKFRAARASEKGE